MALLFVVCVLAGRAGARKLYKATDTAASMLCFLRSLRECAARGTHIKVAVSMAADANGGVFAEKFAHLVASGRSVEDAWSECGISLNGKAAKAELDIFFGSLGKLTRDEQMKAFDRVEAAVFKAKEEANDKAREGGKLRTTLGVLAGFSLVILFV